MADSERYELEIIWTQPHGGTSRWKYIGNIVNLRKELLALSEDLTTHPGYKP